MLPEHHAPLGPLSCHPTAGLRCDIGYEAAFSEQHGNVSLASISARTLTRALAAQNCKRKRFGGFRPIDNRESSQSHHSVFTKTTTWYLRTIHRSTWCWVWNPSNTLSDRSEEVAQRLYRQGGTTTPTRTTRYKSDQICVYTTIDGIRKPILFEEYKAPHKLTVPQIRLVLRAMNIKGEVIDKHILPELEDADAKYQYHADRLVAEVVARVYDYMLESGPEYSFVNTGEALIFLRIPAEVSITILYHLADSKANRLPTPHKCRFVILNLHFESRLQRSTMFYSSSFGRSTSLIFDMMALVGEKYTCK